MDELEFYNGQLTGEEIDKRIIQLSTTVSSLPHTITNSKINVKHIVLNQVLGNPLAQTGDWTVETTNGSLTISGTISGETTLLLVLGIPY